MKNISAVGELKLKYESKQKASDRPKISMAKDAESVFRSIQYYSDCMLFKECFYAMYLNRANKVLAVMLISEGGTISTIVDVKHILKPAIDLNATGLIVSHCHPSGNQQPSESDKQLTQKIKQAAKLFDIELMDHLILTESECFSFTNEGIM